MSVMDLTKLEIAASSFEAGVVAANLIRGSSRREDASLARREKVSRLQNSSGFFVVAANLIRGSSRREKVSLARREKVSRLQRRAYFARR
jgi:hypothetical protein